MTDHVPGVTRSNVKPPAPFVVVSFVEPIPMALALQVTRRPTIGSPASSNTKPSMRPPTRRLSTTSSITTPGATSNSTFGPSAQASARGTSAIGPGFLSFSVNSPLSLQPLVSPPPPHGFVGRLGSSMRTVAPGTGAPLGSTTTPWIDILRGSTKSRRSWVGNVSAAASESACPVAIAVTSHSPSGTRSNAYVPSSDSNIVLCSFWRSPTDRAVISNCWIGSPRSSTTRPANGTGARRTIVAGVPDVADSRVPYHSVWVGGSVVSSSAGA